MSSVLDDKNRKKATAGEEYIEQNGKLYREVNFDEIPKNHTAARAAGYPIFKNSDGGVTGALEGAEADNIENFYTNINGKWYEVVGNPIAKAAGRTFDIAQPAAAVKEKTPAEQPAPAAQTAVEDVQQNEDGGKMTILWPERPEMEKGNYVEQTDAQIAQAQKSAAEQERRAKRDRDMAILSDIANLVTKGAAMHGGAWKIDKEEARSAVANEKLRALRGSNSKLLAEYARRRMEAADADRKDRNAAAKAEYDAEVDKAKLQASIARTEAELKEKKEYNDKMAAIAQQNADTREKEANNKGKGGGKSTTGGSGSGKVKNIRYIGDWGFDFDSAAEVDEAYAKMVQADPSKAAQKRDEFGDLVFNDNPNTAQKRDALTKGGMTATPPSANKGKTAGFSSGKKAGFK